MTPASYVRAVGSTLAVALTLSLTAHAVAAQGGGPPEMGVDPDLPMKEGFDAERAYLGTAPMFEPLRDPEWMLLRQARRQGLVSDDTPMLVFDHGGETRSLITAQMSYHHVAQGDIAGEPWMVTF